MSWIPAAAAVLLISAAAIYLRGYLVPGTPELIQRYFPTRLLALFGKEQPEPQHQTATATDTTEADQTDPGETERLLHSAGVVEDCPHEDDLCLTDEFGEVWWRRIRQLRDDDEQAAAQLAATIDVDPDALEFVEENGFGVSYQGDVIGRWDSRAAFYADLAVQPTLAEHLSDWEQLGDRTRTALIAGIRAFLSACPACESELDQVENVRKSCCAGELVSVSVECDACWRTGVLRQSRLNLSPEANLRPIRQ